MRRVLTGISEVVFGADPNCIVCGKDVVSPWHGLCPNCYGEFPFADRPLIGKALSVCRYEPPVKQMIYDYKYNDERYLGRPMAEMMAWLVRENHLDFDFILTVPSNEKRKAIRGFDHTLYMAQIMSDRLGIACGDGFLVRTRETQRLKGLTKAERLIELDRVFSVEEGEALTGKRLLIIDDILTTGATLSACTEVLMRYKPDSVHWMTFAMVV